MIVSPYKYHQHMNWPLPKKSLLEINETLLSERMHPSHPRWLDFQELLGRTDNAKDQVAEEVRNLFQNKYTVVPRRKSRETLLAKILERPSRPITDIWDHAGVRLTAQMSLIEQDYVAEEIKRYYKASFVKQVDRRAEPKAGYRALHLVVREDHMCVEIQIRTDLQDAYANTYEELADGWGRQIRYGRDPDPGLSGTIAHRQKVIIDLQSLSLEGIASYEQSVARGIESESLKQDLLLRLIELVQEAKTKE